MEHDVFISLGTNLGDRLLNLRTAISLLASDGCQWVALSNIYETPPWGYLNQPAFLNMVGWAHTLLSPQALLEKLKETEVSMGRTPTFRWGPRLIDLDILFYDDLILDTPPLLIPHPRLHERGFVLIPLLDIAPHWVHPLLKRTVAELAAQVDTHGIALIPERLTWKDGRWTMDDGR